jgi:hypothetical protein
MNYSISRFICILMLISCARIVCGFCNQSQSMGDIESQAYGMTSSTLGSTNHDLTPQNNRSSLHNVQINPQSTDVLFDTEYHAPIYQNCCLVYYSQVSATFWHIANDYFDVGSIALQAIAIGFSSADQIEWGGYTKGFQLGAIICGSMHVYATKRSRLAAQQAVHFRELRSKEIQSKKEKRRKAAEERVRRAADTTQASIPPANNLQASTNSQ